MAPGRSTRIGIRMQPAGGLSRIIKSSNAESADPQIMKSFRPADSHKNGRSRSGELCLVGAKEVHHARHEDTARTRGVSAIDEDSEILWRSRHLEDAAHRVFKFAERVRIGKYQFCSGACRQDEPGHRHAAFYISATDARRTRSPSTVIVTCADGYRVAFARVELDPGCTERVCISCRAADLRAFDS